MAFITLYVSICGITEVFSASGMGYLSMHKIESLMKMLLFSNIVFIAETVFST